MNVAMGHSGDIANVSQCDIHIKVVSVSHCDVAAMSHQANIKGEKFFFEVVRLMTVAATCDATWIIEVIANHRTAGGLDRVLPTIMTASTPRRI